MWSNGYYEHEGYYESGNRFKKIYETGNLAKLKALLAEDSQLSGFTEEQIWEGMQEMLHNGVKIIDFCPQQDVTKVKKVLLTAISQFNLEENSTENIHKSVVVDIFIFALKNELNTTLKFLTENGLNIYQDQFLHEVVQETIVVNNLEMMELFLKEGQWKPEQKDQALIFALDTDSLAITRLLIAHGANVNAKTLLNSFDKVSILQAKFFSARFFLNKQTNTLNTDSIKLMSLLLRNKAVFNPEVNETDAEALDTFVYEIWRVFEEYHDQQQALQLFRQDIKELLKEIILAAGVKTNANFITDFSQKKISLTEVVAKYIDPEICKEMSDWQLYKADYNKNGNVRPKQMFFAQNYKEQIDKTEENPANSTSLISLQFG